MGKQRIPVVATLVVLAAVAVMIRLGFWQLDRMAEEERKLAQHAAAAADPQPIAFPAGVVPDSAHYRRSMIACQSPGNWRGTAGSSASGEAGYVQIVECRTADGGTVQVQAGWSRRLDPPPWAGGDVTGIIAPNRDGSSVLVADPPLAGMEANALPAPDSDQPGKNLAYAGQWFFFALTALLIYGLALRRRWKAGEAALQGE
ncbi:SURF1 family cytochrome oxidase biogenesis protein [Alteraurantiacibacter buctensis]|uniref:SURF1-like protein n=1 Tax=Alteraurantiacibacter buctensis TaxID=1503981 RepID=A0A844YSG0_9SPHN|nr:SURF1 family cytochrome oxidase biogenesis protein [Alteraurantiacibacter buctensis]MXO71285.1 SURF1 family protein [Alteraurantiacibacter buctensis]